jgi:hypothetical protein
MDVVNFTFIDSCLFQFGDNTVLTIYVIAVVAIQQKGTITTSITTRDEVKRLFKVFPLGLRSAVHRPNYCI